MTVNPWALSSGLWREILNFDEYMYWNLRISFCPFKPFHNLYISFLFSLVGAYFSFVSWMKQFGVSKFLKRLNFLFEIGLSVLLIQQSNSSSWDVKPRDYLHSSVCSLWKSRELLTTPFFFFTRVIRSIGTSLLNDRVLLAVSTW